MRISFNIYTSPFYGTQFKFNQKLPCFFKADIFIDNQNIGHFKFLDPHQCAEYYIRDLKPIKFYDTINKGLIKEISISDHDIQKYQYISELYSIDGYQREAALKKIPFKQYKDDLEIFEALLLRLNDWVHPVRLASQKAMFDFLLVSSNKFLIDYFHKLHHLANCQRANHESFIQTVEKRLIADKDLLTITLLGINYLSAKNSYYLIKKYSVFTSCELLNIAHKIKDVTVLYQISQFINYLNKEDFLLLEKNLTKLKNKHFISKMLELYVKFEINKNENIYKNLIHKYKMVSDVAFYLAKQYNLDPLAEYKRILANYKTIPSQDILAVFRMHEYYSSIEEFLFYLKEIFEQCSITTIRTKSLHILFKIDPVIAKNYVKILLLSAHEEDVTIGLKFSIQYFKFKASELQELILKAKTENAQKGLVNLISKLTDWERLIVCLELYTHNTINQYKKLGIYEKLINSGIMFRSTKYEPIVSDWLLMNNGHLNNEIFKLLSKSYHGQKYLDYLYEHKLITKSDHIE